MCIVLDDKILGPIVQLIRVTFDGEIVHHYLNAPIAVVELLTDPKNGAPDGYCRGWINWSLENINSRDWDTSF